MKEGFLFWACSIILFFTVAVSAQHQWSDPITISGGVSPDFDIDRNTGHLHIISMYSGVIYTETNRLGEILVHEAIPGTETESGGWNFGASIAVDSEGNPHVCYRFPLDYLLYNIYYVQRSYTGWGPPYHIASNVTRGYMVRLEVDPFYRTHIAWGIATSGLWGNVSYVCIQDRRIIIRQDNIAGPNLYRADDRIEIDASNDGIAHLAIGCPNSEQGPISYYRSQSAGSYLEYVADIHAIACTGRNGSPDVFVDLTGNVHMCYGSQYDMDIGGAGSVRYVRYEGNTRVRNTIVNKAGELRPWKEGNGWGLGSVAASDEGSIVVVAYVTKDEGDLYAAVSTNQGVTWSNPSMLATGVGGYEGRSKHLVRAYRNNFYVLYPCDDETVRLRYLLNVGDSAPVSAAGGPYSGTEGSPVTFDGSASVDEGPNSGIAEYAWDWENDGEFDTIADSALAVHTFTDDFDGQVVLRVKDNAEQLDYDTTTIQIANAPPTANAGEDIQGEEGDILELTVYITDPGSDEHTATWRFNQSETKEGTTVSHAYGDQGEYSVIVTVTDDDGGIDKDTVHISLTNVNPTADAGGPYSSPVGETITFTGNAIDPGFNDQHIYQWDLNGDGFYEVEGQTTSKSYPDTGKHIIWLRVMDDEGGFGVDTALVRIMDDTPVISSIPGQTIDEGETFPPLELDFFVSDPYQSDDELVWTVTGYDELIVTLENRILTVAVPDSEWFGVENLRLVVTDPKNFMDSTIVTYTVRPVNDPPRWGNVPDYTFNEDDTLKVPFSSLDTLVTDVDDDIANLNFWITDNAFVQWRVDSLQDMLCFFAPPDWYGKEEVTFVVVDTSGALDQKTSVWRVVGTPDPPYAFSLIDPLYTTYTDWPDSIEFQWHPTTDPDSASHVYYEWTLRLQGGSSLRNQRSQPVLDTTLVFIPDGALAHGTYLWWVSAYDETGLFRKSSNLGILIVSLDSDVQHPEKIIPTRFDLLPNAPNPFNPETHITYHLPKDSEVRLIVYNALGQQVRILDEGMKEAGIYHLVWDGRNTWGQRVPSGVYLCRLIAGSKVFLRKMLLVQ